MRRPLSDAERGRAFGFAAAALVAAAVALTLTADPPNDRQPAATPAPADPIATAQTPERGAAEPRAAARAPRRVLRVARRFLDGYLGYLYGRRRAERVGAATRALRRQLAAHPPRLTPAIRRRRPRVVRLGGHALGRRWLVTATIRDGGAASYPVELVIGTRGGRLVVTLVAAED